MQSYLALLETLLIDTQPRLVAQPITEPPIGCAVPFVFFDCDAFTLVARSLHQFLYEYEQPPCSAHLSPRRYREYLRIFCSPWHYGVSTNGGIVLSVEEDGRLNDDTVLFLI